MLKRIASLLAAITALAGSSFSQPLRDQVRYEWVWSDTGLVSITSPRSMRQGTRNPVFIKVQHFDRQSASRVHLSVHGNGEYIIEPADIELSPGKPEMLNIQPFGYGFRPVIFNFDFATGRTQTVEIRQRVSLDILNLLLALHERYAVITYFVVALQVILAYFMYRRFRQHRQQHSPAFINAILDYVARRTGLRHEPMGLTVVCAIAARKARQIIGAQAFLLASVIVTSFMAALSPTAAARLSSLITGIVLLGFNILLFLSERVLQYRIRHGMYGTNEYEAREVVHFLLRHAKDTNFSGGSGLREDAQLDELVERDYGLLVSHT